MRDPLDRSWRRAQRAWAAVGEQDPYWGVLSVPGMRHRWTSDEALSSFRQKGDAQAAELTDEFRRLTRLPPEESSVLDFGCGVGRLTVPLARQFREVVGADISHPMLMAARDYARENGLEGKAKFETVTTPEWTPDRTFDFVIAILTIQHMSASVSARVLDTLFRCTAPRGVLYFNTVSTRTSRLAATMSPLSTRIHRVFAHHRLASRIEMHALPPERVVRLLEGFGAEVRIATDATACKGWVGHVYVVAHRRVPEHEDPMEPSEQPTGI